MPGCLDLPSPVEITSDQSGTLEKTIVIRRPTPVVDTKEQPPALRMPRVASYLTLSRMANLGAVVRIATGAQTITTAVAKALIVKTRTAQAPP
ncbi:unnamed protein product [Schistocephalus solidus]|uniref:Transposase n=1 Tax=Schistocephalus solidus TaxID=70667 RepID=A0A183TGL1_SCHSO|nr:unnamed protein product [Schistocephalus solidus]